MRHPVSVELAASDWAIILIVLVVFVVLWLVIETMESAHERAIRKSRRPGDW